MEVILSELFLHQIDEVFMLAACHSLVVDGRSYDFMNGGVVMTILRPETGE